MRLPSLDGFTVGITADRRWEEQAELLRRRGASVFHGPSIRTLPLGPEEGLRDATEVLIARPPEVLIANTGIGIRAWLAAAESWGIGEALLETLSEVRIYARGPKASGAIHQAGLTVTARATTERLLDVVALAVVDGVEGQSVAFQRHGDDAPEAIDALVTAGAAVTEIPVYQWRLPDDPKPAIRLAEAAVAGKLHAITFTSAPAVRNLLAIAADEGLDEALVAAMSGPVVTACVGPVCAGAAVAVGIVDPVVPPKARLGPMVLRLAEVLVSHAREVVVLGHVLTVQGTAVLVDGRTIDLSDREAGVLAELVESGGAVVHKVDLLKAVWGADASDEHVIEVTVARLRRRLGHLGAAIESIPRRGYRLAMAS